MVVDAAGYVFVADNNRVVEMVSGGTQLTLSLHGFAGASEMAIDPTGNLFVVAGDAAGPQLLELTVTGSQKVVPLRNVFRPSAVAVDHQGNIFVADAGLFLDVGYVQLPKFVELRADGVQVTLPLPAPTALAVDHAGNLFVGRSPPAGSTATLVELPQVGGLNAAMNVPLTDVPDALAVDGSGNIFATSPGKVQELPISLAAAEATTTTTAPAGLPSLAVTGEPTALPLAAAAGLVGLVLAARQMRRRLDLSG